MATWDRNEITTTVVEYTVPATGGGACWVEVYKVVAAIHAELVNTGELAQGEDAPDDRIRITPGDDAIAVSYVKRA